jgi:hypothetical protein
MSMWETILGVAGTAFLGVLGWAVNLSNRVTIIETQQMDLRTLIESKFEEVNRRLERIENAMNGKLNHD